jgi:hypothetical protein
MNNKVKKKILLNHQPKGKVLFPLMMQQAWVVGPEKESLFTALQSVK